MRVVVCIWVCVCVRLNVNVRECMQIYELVDCMNVRARVWVHGCRCGYSHVCVGMTVYLSVNMCVVVYGLHVSVDMSVWVCDPVGVCT